MDFITHLFSGLKTSYVNVIENNAWELTDFFYNGFQLTVMSHKVPVLMSSSIPNINDLAEFRGVDHKIYLYADYAKFYNTITSKEDQLCLQQVINRIKEWCNKWLLKLNISKCKTESYCVKNMIDTEYFVSDGCIDHGIEKLTNIKDLGVVFDSELSFRDDIQLKINKAYSIFTARYCDENSVCLSVCLSHACIVTKR